MISKCFVLTDREIDVLNLLATGKRNREIAKSLNITENTTEAHLKNIFRKIDVCSRIEAAIAWNAIKTEYIQN